MEEGNDGASGPMTKKVVANDAKSATTWLRRLGSNQRMRESKSRALPLGYASKYQKYARRSALRIVFFSGVDNRIRTDDLQGHNLAL